MADTESPGSNRKVPTANGKILRKIESMSSLRTTASSRSLGIFDCRIDYEIVFVDPLPKAYECPVCQQVLRYPVQFEDCGHRCCSACLPELLRVEPRCPIDQVKVERSKVYVDKDYQKEIEQLAVLCSWNTGGCPWQSCLRELTNHLSDCEYAMMKCPRKCSIEFEKRFLTKHMEEDCSHREVDCEHCHTTMRQADMDEHLKQCKRFPVPCPNNCGVTGILRKDVQKHVDTECPRQAMPCPFVDAGCEFQTCREEMDKHMKKESSQHLNLVGESLGLFRKTMDAHAQTIDVHTERLTTIESNVSALCKLHGAQLVWKIKGYADKFSEAKSGRTPSVFSPTFMTSRHGYKLLVSSCLFGDGKARGKYMSMFVCVCKGEYDPIVLWPFCHRVTFTLLDQCQDPAARRNVTCSVKPNVCKENKPFLCRPTGERNASFGIQQFVELDVLNTLDYIRDDTLFILVSVDPENMLTI